jgi:hypothetical protein
MEGIAKFKIAMMNIELKIEKDEKLLWGEVMYDDNLIVDSAGNIEALEENMKKTAVRFSQFATVRGNIYSQKRELRCQDY